MHKTKQLDERDIPARRLASATSAKGCATRLGRLAMGNPLRRLLRFWIDSCLRLSGGRCWLVCIDKAQGYQKSTAHASAEDTIRNSQRQVVRPLVHGLIGNTHQTGRADCITAQKLYCLIFQHASIKP